MRVTPRRSVTESERPRNIQKQWNSLDGVRTYRTCWGMVDVPVKKTDQIKRVMQQTDPLFTAGGELITQADGESASSCYKRAREFFGEDYIVAGDC